MHELGEWFQYGNIEAAAPERDFQMQLLEKGSHLNRRAFGEYEGPALSEVELLYRCSTCRATMEGHVFQPCPSCGSVPTFTPCPRCRIAVRNPLP